MLHVRFLAEKASDYNYILEFTEKLILLTLLLHF